FTMAPANAAATAATAVAAAAGGPSAAPGGGGGRLLPLPRPGDWIKLKNVTPRFVRGQLQLSFCDKSHIVARAEKDSTKDRKAYEARMTGGPRGPPCLNTFAPTDEAQLLARPCYEWQELPLRTLRQVLMQQDTCDCTPARVMARVVAFMSPQPSSPPAAGADATSPGRAEAPACPQAGGSRNNQPPAFGLVLQDATASLRVELAGLSAAFFCGLSQGGCSSSSGGGVVTRARAAKAARQSQPPPEPQSQVEECEEQRLLAVLRRLADQGRPGGSWIECVLRPLYARRDNPWQTTLYSLEHTVLQQPLPPPRLGGPAAPA
ncbi:hypothetical protein Agub_g12285, partial [Astrephomene gubernaculifera]